MFVTFLNKIIHHLINLIFLVIMVHSYTSNKKMLELLFTFFLYKLSAHLSLLRSKLLPELLTILESCRDQEELAKDQVQDKDQALCTCKSVLSH